MINFQNASSSFSLNVTSALVAQFDQLLDLNSKIGNHQPDLTLVQLLLCFRTEILNTLFILLFLCLWAVIAIGRQFTHLYVRRRRGSFILRKKGIYTVESFIFNSFQQRINRLDWSSETENNNDSFDITPSKYLFAKKCIVLALVVVQLVEFYLNITLFDFHGDIFEYFTKSNIIQSHSILSCLIRLLALFLIVYYLFCQTQPSEQIIFSNDSLSPSIYSRVNQALISIFWFIILLNTALSIQLSSAYFMVNALHQNVTSQIPISIQQICTACHWNSFLQTDTNQISQTDLLYNTNNFKQFDEHHLMDSRHANSNHYLNWLYLGIFFVQLLLGFFPDYDVKLHSEYDSSIENLCHLVNNGNSKTNKLKVSFLICF